MNRFLPSHFPKLRFAQAVACLSLTLAATSSAALLWTDNFNVGDTNNLDASPQAGRHTGLFADDIVLRSAKIQEGIVSQQLNFLQATNDVTGRVRFQVASQADSWLSFGSGAVGSSILADGGLRVEFDWISGNTTSDNWIAVDIGGSPQSVTEPNLRVNDGATDAAILFRYRGATQIFDNGGATEGGAFAPLVGTRHVVVDYLFNSFADGSPVTMNASIDGTQVWSATSSTFDWNNNGGAIYLELESHEDTKLDNVSVSTIPEPSTILATLMGGVALLSARRRPRSGV
jgi:hypothetical protein